MKFKIFLKSLFIGLIGGLAVFLGSIALYLLLN